MYLLYRLNIQEQLVPFDEISMILNSRMHKSR
jgi:hypothetical protein